MDRLDELAVLLAILDAGSLAGAARRLRRSPPAITRALGALETRLGARLIERTTRRQAPTEAGRKLGERARRLLAEYDDAIQAGAEAAAELSGLIRITAPLVFGRLHVAPVVSRFLAMHPRVRAELVLSDRYVDLVEEGLDLAVRIGALPDSGLVARRVGQVRRMLVASPGYVAARGMPHDPGELAGHDIIHTAGRPVPPEWRFRAGTRPWVVRLSPRLSVNQVDAALAAARDGQGIAAALSYQVADDIAAARLVRVLAAFEPPPLPVQLVTATGRHMSRRVRAFLDQAVQALSRLDVLRRG